MGKEDKVRYNWKEWDNCEIDVGNEGMMVSQGSTENG